jgi:hypothetical protein
VRRYTLGVLLVCLSITSAAHAYDKSIGKSLKDMYAKKAEYSRKKDIKSLIALNTPDYKVVLRGGKTMNNEQLEEQLKLFFGLVVRNIRFDHEIKGIEVNGDGAVVLVEQKDKRIQKFPDGKPHEVEANVIHRDTWIKTTSGWKLKLTEEQEQTKLTIDGKAVSP